MTVQSFIKQMIAVAESDRIELARLTEAHRRMTLRARAGRLTDEDAVSLSQVTTRIRQLNDKYRA